MTHPKDEFDLFLSYQWRDYATVERIARALTREGLRVFLDRWYLTPGLPWPEALEWSLGRCRAVAVFVGPEGLGPWQLREHYLALDRQTRERAFSVIPVLLPGADPPLGFLRLNAWVDLRDGIDDEAALALLRSTASGLPPDPQATTRSNQARAEVCPYRGLQVFREEDAPFFCGREHFTQRLAEAVGGDSVVAVVGTSGSGKSSVVRAGLLPLLRAGADDRKWEIVTLLPGERPLRALAAALMPKLEPDLSEIDQLVEIGKLADHFVTGAVSLRDAGQRILAKQLGTDRLLVFVDQWEELYTLCTDNASRQGFVAQLLNAAKDDLFNIVLTLRGDFFAWPLADRELADALEKAQVNLGPMTRDELARAISSPAVTLGLEFEPGLVDRILDDVGDEPGNLPLLEFVLASLWERRRGATLHFKAYQAIGGVTGAIAERADAIFEKRFTPEQQQAARRVLMRMVRPGTGTEDTRKRIPLPADDETALDIIQPLADARLVVTGRDAAGDTVEVTHEALIQNWGRLRGWVNEDRGFLITRERVEASADLWEKEDRTSDRLLAPGRPLAEAEELLADRRADLGPGLIQFIQASLTAEKTREARERAVERRRLRRARLAASAMSALAVASIVLGFFAYWKSEDEQVARLAAEKLTRVAEEQRNVADRQRQMAVSRLLAQEALRFSETGRKAALIENAAALAVESWRRRKNPTAMAAAMILLPMLPEITIPHGGDVIDIAYSRDGSLLVAASEDGSIQINDAKRGAMIRRFPFKLPANKVILSPDGSLIVSSHNNEKRSGDETYNVGRLLETETGREIASFPLQDSRQLILSPDGQLIAFPSSRSEIRLLDTDTGEERFKLRISNGDGVSDIAFSNDSRFLATIVRLGPSEKSAHLISTAQGEEVGRIHHGDWIGHLAFSTDGHFLATAHSGGQLRLTSTETGEEIETLEVGGRVTDVEFSPNGQFLALSHYSSREDTDQDGVGGVRVLSTETLEEIATIQSDKSVCWGVDFSPNSLLAVSRCRLDGNTGAGVSQLINTETGSVVSDIKHEDAITKIAFSDDGRLLATTSEDGTASLVATSDGGEIARLRHGAKVGLVAFSPGNNYLATDSADGGLRVFDTANGEPLTRLTKGFQGLGFAFSPRLPATIAWADRDGNVRLFREFHGTNLMRIAPSHSIRFFQVSPNGRRLASIDQFGTLRLATIPDGKVLSEVKELDNSFLRYSRDGKHLAAVRMGGKGAVILLESQSGRVVSEVKSAIMGPPVFSEDDRFFACPIISNKGRKVALFDLRSQSGWIEMPGAGNPVAFSPDGRILATDMVYSADGYSASLWDTENGRQTVRIPIEDSLGWIKFGPKLRYMALGRTHQGTISLEDVRTREVIATLQHGEHAWSAFSPDGRFVATSSYDGSVTLLHADSGKEITHYSDPGPLIPVTFSSDSRYLGTVTEEGHARLLEIETGKVLNRFSLDPSAWESENFDILFSPRNKFVVFGRWNGDARLIATADGHTVAEIAGLGQMLDAPLLFSRDERLLAVLHENQVVSLYETRTGKTIGRIRHDGDVSDLSLSANGRYLLTRSSGDVVRLVSTDTGAQVARYSPEGGVADAEFVLDGEMVAFGTQAGVQLHPSDPEVLFSKLCAKAGNNLSQDEWADYIGAEEPWRATCPNWTPSVIGQQ